jgi:hypothetical protein
MTQPSIASIQDAAPESPHRSPAVQRCCAAHDRSLQESREQGLSEYKTSDKADKAYLAAMPELSGYENIRDFIACVSFGVLVGYISPIESPRFLYGAQVAISALRLEPKDKKGSAT